MATIHLNSDQFTYAASDVLRLFFGKVTTSADGLILRAGAEDPVWSAGCKNEEIYVWQREPNDAPVPTSFEGDALRLKRRELKQKLYDGLASWSGMSFPWGSLTGIRPTLVAEELWEANGRDPGKAVDQLTQTYKLTLEKAVLCVDTMLEERRLLGEFPPDEVAVYVGIPFCPTRCYYCSFTMPEGIGRKVDEKDLYVEALCDEIRLTLSELPVKIRSLYIGGGTPTDLTADQLERIFSTIVPLIMKSRAGDGRLPELCLEAGRPDTITRDKLMVARCYGFDRVCINPQTMKEETLVRIGRRHSVDEVRQAFSLARECGFEDINMDLIAGLQGETVEDLRRTLEEIGTLSPDSITVHALAVKRSSDLNKAMAESGRELSEVKGPRETVAEMMRMADTFCRERGLVPYYLYRQKDGLGGLENIGYARPGRGNLYNIGMMGDARSVLAFGAGAMSKRHFGGGRVERSPNVKSIHVYRERHVEMAKRKIALFTEPSDVPARCKRRSVERAMSSFEGWSVN